MSQYDRCKPDPRGRGGGFKRAFGRAKYIQLRKAEGKLTQTSGRLVHRSATLLTHQRDWIRRTDTFFIATLNPGEGADASHRGGMPGFVRVENQELMWPDYAGERDV